MHDLGLGGLESTPPRRGLHDITNRSGAASSSAAAAPKPAAHPGIGRRARPAINYAAAAGELYLEEDGGGSSVPLSGAASGADDAKDPSWEELAPEARGVGSSIAGQTNQAWTDTERQLYLEIHCFALDTVEPKDANALFATVKQHALLCRRHVVRFMEVHFGRQEEKDSEAGVEAIPDPETLCDVPANVQRLWSGLGRTLGSFEDFFYKAAAQHRTHLQQVSQLAQAPLF